MQICADECSCGQSQGQQGSKEPPEVKAMLLAQAAGLIMAAPEACNQLKFS